MLQQGLKEEALELLKGILEEEPFYLGVRRLVAEIAFEIGEDETAIEEFSVVNSMVQWDNQQIRELLPEVEVVEEAPEETAEEEEVLVLDEEELEEADEEFQTVEMAQTYLRQCLFEEALKVLEKVLEREPENQEAQELKEKVEEYLSYLTPEEPAA